MYNANAIKLPTVDHARIAQGPWPPKSMPPTQMTPQLWQGPLVPKGTHLHAMGFDAVVLCAEEHQPRGNDIPGVLVIHCPFDDDGVTPPSPAQQMICRMTARRVTELLREGKHVLITCAEGRNRSGLVMALVLREQYRISGAAAVQHIRTRRDYTLTNIGFLDLLLPMEAP